MTVIRKQSVPMAMAVGLTDQFLRRQEPAIARAGAVLLSTTVANASEMVTWWSPGVLIITEDVYAFDSTRFDDLAKAVGATLAVLPGEDASPTVVERIVADAVSEGRRMWAHPSSTKPPNISTVRRAVRPHSASSDAKYEGPLPASTEDSEPPTVRQPAVARRIG